MIDRNAPVAPDGSPGFEILDVGYQGLPGAANAYLLRTHAGPVLIETGPQACLRTLESRLKEAGVDPAAIAHVFVTHIHLDHAGAAGAFAARGAAIHVHPLGAPHLVDPAKLIASSRRVHGTDYERFYGDPIPAPADRVIAEPDGARIDLGSIVIEAIETPGHAKHHHAWMVRASSGAGGAMAFTGDVAATIVPGPRVPGAFIAVPTPPPEYDREAWLRSLERLRAAHPDRLVLTHGGIVPDPSRHLDEVEARLLKEDAWLRSELKRACGPGLIPRDPAVIAKIDAAVLERYRPWLHGLADAAGVARTPRDVFIGDAWMRMNIMGVRRAMTLEEKE